MKLRPFLLLLSLLSLHTAQSQTAEPEFPLTADSKPQTGVAKGTLIKDRYVAGQDSVFPGTERDYQIYLPAGFAKDGTQPAPFMVFQDGVLYQAPVVFDNLIAKKDIPPLIGIFIRPGVVPAAHENALPRFNRSHEYDSVTPTYSDFLIQEFLPAIEKKHRLKLSTDPNQAAISGNSSGGICAFMTAWHRPDRFRRVFTGVGTYVGIHGADRLPILLRKQEPKPLRVFLQSGTNDNNLYCGDWWMANQMMERSLTWAGYEVNHAWGEGGHNQKHASQVFPDALRWLWKDWQTNPEVKANVKGESKWKGYEVMKAGSEWAPVLSNGKKLHSLAADMTGIVYAIDYLAGNWWRFPTDGAPVLFGKGHYSSDHGLAVTRFVKSPDGKLLGTGTDNLDGISIIGEDGKTQPSDISFINGWSLCVGNDGWFYMGKALNKMIYAFATAPSQQQPSDPTNVETQGEIHALALSPDQTLLYATIHDRDEVHSFQITKDHQLVNEQSFFLLETGTEKKADAGGLCVDTDGRLYVATALGIQVCDQAGRVNFIIPTPKPATDVCFGGKDLSELFIACGDTIYKRTMQVRGVVSGQQAPIKPAPPKL